MSTSKPGSQPGRATGTERNEELERSLDENLAVQGKDEPDADTISSGDEGLEALDDNNGDAFGDNADGEDFIPLPDATLNRGSRRI